MILRSLCLIILLSKVQNWFSAHSFQQNHFNSVVTNKNNPIEQFAKLKTGYQVGASKQKFSKMILQYLAIVFFINCLELGNTVFIIIPLIISYFINNCNLTNSF